MRWRHEGPQALNCTVQTESTSGTSRLNSSKQPHLNTIRYPYCTKLYHE